MPTVTYTIAASHDDVEYGPVVGCNNDGDYLRIRTSAAGVVYAVTGLRFITVPLMGSSVIVASAHLRLRSQGNTTGDNINIHGLDEDNAATFEAPNCNPGDRSLTTASVLWTTAAMVAGTWYETADIASVVQEILDRAGRASGGPVGFKLQAAANDIDIGFYAYDQGDHSSAPQLHVTYRARFQGGGFI